MALHSQSRPEPMNATPHHSKVKVAITLSDSFYIAGNAVTGKIELESRADRGLGLSIIMVELVAIEELTSRDHSATSTFLHTRRLFQGPGLPPSNAVLPHPVAGEPPLPAHHHRARRGLTTFLFRLPLPAASPSSIDFGNGLARIRYEVRASVGVAWKDQNRLVTDKCPVDVLRRYPGDDASRAAEGGLGFDTWPAPEGLIVGEGGKIWVKACLLGGILVAGESACIELQLKNHSAKRTAGLHVTLGRQLHLPAPAPASNAGRKLPHPLQISDALASVTFRGPEYIAHPGTEGIAHLVFDVPRTTRTVSAYPRHGDDLEEDGPGALERKTAPLFEVRGILEIRVVMPVGSKDIVLELPVAAFHPATLPPPPPEPYPYPAPDRHSSPYLNHDLHPSPPPPGPTPILYADRAHSPLYTYPTPPPALLLLPQSIPAPSNAQLVIPPFRAYDGQLWFQSPPPTSVGGPYYDRHPPPRPASANVGIAEASFLPAGLPLSDIPDYHHHFSYQQQQHYPSLPEQSTGYGARAARISHHLRATSRARSASPPSKIPPPTPVAVDVVAPKPMPSPKVITETLTVTDDDSPFAQSFGRVGTRTRSLSVVKLEEMAARAAAETEAAARAETERREAAVEKTLPAPPVPSGKPSDYRANQRLVAHEIFHQGFERGGGAGSEAVTEMLPRTPSLSALSLLRPPLRHDNIVPSSHAERGIGENGLDALERRLVEQVGTRKHPALPPDVRTILELESSPLPPPPPVPAPVPVPGKSMAQEQEDDDGAGAAVNESAISSLALAAEEDFGGRNANAKLALPDVEVEAEEEAEGEDVDADGRTQHPGKGAGASSSSERGTYKALSRKSAKSDDRGKEKKAKKRRDRREGRGDDEAARLKRAAKGRVAEWLGKLEVDDSEPDIRTGPGPAIPPESPAAALPTEPTPIATDSSAAPPIIESAPNPRSSGFVSVATLRRAPISLPVEPAPSSSTSTPTMTPIATPALGPARQPGQRYPPPSQVEMKYNVKSARGGRGGRVTAVAAIWAAEAAKATDSNATADSGSGAATPTPRQAKAARLVNANANAAQTKAAAAPNTNKLPHAPVPIKPMPPAGTRTPRPRHPPPAPREREREREREARPPRALFGLGLGTAAAAVPSSPALSASVATPMLSSTASLARPPATTGTAPAPPAPRDNATRALSPSSSPWLPTQSQTQSQSQSRPSPVAGAGAGQRPAIVNGGEFKAELAFGRARLRDLIKRYQGQAA